MNDESRPGRLSSWWRRPEPALRRMLLNAIGASWPTPLRNSLDAKHSWTRTPALRDKAGGGRPSNELLLLVPSGRSRGATRLVLRGRTAARCWFDEQPSGSVQWARLVSNQRPLACEASAL